MTCRLATYGSLAPDRANHHELAGLVGRWFQGTVRGRLVEAGWGAALGFPGLELAPDGVSVTVDIFESIDLHRHWLRLDAFEGGGYRRVLTSVETKWGARDAWIYVLANSEGVGL